MVVRVFEIECANPGCAFIPVRQTLRRRRGVPHIVLPEPAVGAIHVADDNRNMLEPPVIAARVCRNWPSLWSKELGQFDLLLAEPKYSSPHSNTDDAFQMLEF